ncbi:DUF4145 domain-containing protein [Aquaspirillum sp. LM1]|uniref:DUF4145 domain-containing protein n=1 Tax=Aquaspirillum sp. LM1 TaxID=1938604 RepID=UPI001C0AD2E9|nr:DUF4145 domain-containing protein [Aquaspirillum sp. LM1]
MLDESLFPLDFNGNKIPIWPCPQCGAQSLHCENNNFHKHHKEPIDTNDPDFDPSWITYIFTMHLKCTNASCGCGVVCTGTGEVQEEDFDNGIDGYDRTWKEIFHAKYFEPPLQIFTPPTGTPKTVKQALETSFSTFFFSPSLSLSALRASLEALLDEKNIAKRSNNDHYLNLENRVKLLDITLGNNSTTITEYATAIRFLGNNGTHPGEIKIQQSDVFDGYKIFEHILITLYPEEKPSFDFLVESINTARGVVRKK